MTGPSCARPRGGNPLALPQAQARRSAPELIDSRSVAGSKRLRRTSFLVVKPSAALRARPAHKCFRGISSLAALSPVFHGHLCSGRPSLDE